MISTTTITTTAAAAMPMIRGSLDLSELLSEVLPGTFALFCCTLVISRATGVAGIADTVGATDAA